MNRIDHLSLDGHSLKLLLTVLEEGSVTAAAGRLDLTQSAVSHSLQRLRAVLGDPLFVKSGRGIVATAHALALADHARHLLDQLENFARPPVFDAASAQMSLTIAANDFQAEVLLPRVFRVLAETAARIDLRIIPSGTPSADLLRDRRCNLILSPVPPEGTDILRRRLFEDRYLCFYDAGVRDAPLRFEDFLAARHITVVHPEADRLEFDKRLDALGIDRDIVIRVAGFAGVPGFLKGSAMLASLPGLLRRNLMQGLAAAPIPTSAALSPDATLLPMYMAWHQRDQGNPAHVWVRSVMVKVAQEVTRDRGQGA